MSIRDLFFIARCSTIFASEPPETKPWINIVVLDKGESPSNHPIGSMFFTITPQWRLWNQTFGHDERRIERVNNNKIVFISKESPTHQFMLWMTHGLIFVVSVFLVEDPTTKLDFLIQEFQMEIS